MVALLILLLIGVGFGVYRLVLGLRAIGAERSDDPGRAGDLRTRAAFIGIGVTFASVTLLLLFLLLSRTG